MVPASTDAEPCRRFGCKLRSESRFTQSRQGAMYTRDLLFGMNILSLAGFAVMGLSLTLRRMAQAGAPLCVALMCAGTALVFIGLYAGGSSN
jgi:hypothetical protein